MEEQNDNFASVRSDPDKELSNYPLSLKRVKQMKDVALLQSDLVKGAALSEFMKRTAKLL